MTPDVEIPYFNAVELDYLLERCGALVTEDPLEISRTKRYNMVIIDVEEDDGSKDQHKQTGI